ncbi:hypothetical protein M0Q28_04490 [Patescibacteria group bacterium]|jgi:ClpP class serine protease|nr:hypothetical protein [Patescibacteria group bacterium]
MSDLITPTPSQSSPKSASNEAPLLTEVGPEQPASPTLSASDLKRFNTFDRFRKLAEDKATKPWELKKAASEYLVAELGEDPIFKKYNVVFVNDEHALVRTDVDDIHSALKNVDTRPVLLVLNSPGGSIEAGYFISKLCRETPSGRFEVAVPRRAKSAATLICCGADAIHMGSLSELGPIDPQIDEMPALGLKNAVQHLAGLVKTTPEAAEMFASYLAKALKLEQLGYYERVVESAEQYATHLLDLRGDATTTGEKGLEPKTIAHRLVHEYKDHGFVIDVKEARGIFGEARIKRDTEEHRFSERVYDELRLIQILLTQNAKRRYMYLVGSLADGLTVAERPATQPQKET